MKINQDPDEDLKVRILCNIKMCTYKDLLDSRKSSTLNP